MDSKFLSDERLKLTPRSELLNNSNRNEDNRNKVLIK